MKRIFALFFLILFFNCSEQIPITIDTDIRTAQKDQIWIFLGEKSVLRKEPKLLDDQIMAPDNYLDAIYRGTRVKIIKIKELKFYVDDRSSSLDSHWANVFVLDSLNREIMVGWLFVHRGNWTSNFLRIDQKAIPNIKTAQENQIWSIVDEKVILYKEPKPFSLLNHNDSLGTIHRGTRIKIIKITTLPFFEDKSSDVDNHWANVFILDSSNREIIAGWLHLNYMNAQRSE